ncbi:MAG: hypothetical protein ACOCVQ_02665 [Bacillota bacterium]
METVALVGASGTGKSQRALVVAGEIGTPYIVDDGLFIRSDKILAGKSAKAETTKVAAVRRAIFDHPEHAEEVRRAIRRESPEKIIILGTSREMIIRIVNSLQLPSISAWLNIEDVAAAEDIAAALKTRRNRGEHVIPVPTMEVTKTLVGYIINPLRLLYQGGVLRKPVIIEKSVVRPTYSTLGRFYIADRVVASIASYALRDVPWLRLAMSPVTREGDGGISVTLICFVDVTAVSGEGFRWVQVWVKDAIEEMTSLPVGEVNISLVGADPELREGRG